MSAHEQTAACTRQMIGLLAVTGRDTRPEIDALAHRAATDRVPNGLGLSVVDWVEMCSRHAHPEQDGQHHALVAVGVVRRMGHDEEGSE